MNNTVSTRKKLIFFFLALLPLVALLIATELKLRNDTAAWYEKKLLKNHALKKSLLIHRKSNDALLIYELTPGAEIDRQGVHYKINQAGFRDKEFTDVALPKEPDEYRIVVIGDSVAWGWGVDIQKVWSYQLERNLQNNTHGKRVTVFNMAVNGYATSQEVRVLEKNGLDYKPDLVILNYVLNDPEVEDGGLSWYFASRDRIELYYKGKLLLSLLGNVVKNALHIESNAPMDRTLDHYYLIHNSDLFENVRNGFAALADVTHKQALPVLVIVTPVFEFTKMQQYPWAGIHQQIAELADANHFMFVDTQPALSGYDAKDLSFDPIHPNALGHSIIAEAVMKKIEEEKLLSAKPL